MMILARPSISTYLARTLYELHVPAVLADTTMTVPMKPAIQTLSLAEFAGDPKRAYRSLVLTNSENALSHLYDVIPYDDRIMKARLFKDKAAFRRAIAKKFPGFFFQEVCLDQLSSVNPKTLPFPVVLKPAIGISSIGVIRVAGEKDWPGAVDFLKNDLENYQRNYAKNVVESQMVLIERYIEGRELAIDGYFNQDSEPVVLNLLEHLFQNALDTSDRLYCTQKSLVQAFYEPVMQFLRQFGEIFDLRRFPFHLELRVSPEGELIPIELNPLRFSGLGTTEIAQFAYGINVYESFFTEKNPDWSSILNREDDSIYSFVCADVPTDQFRKPGLRILDRKLFKEFSEVLEYRILDDEETSTFAVIFFRSTEVAECQKFLSLDLSRYLEVSI